VPVGKEIYKNASSNLSPVTLELGGKSPMIIAKDALLDQAVSGAITSMRFTRQGQSCTAASRIFVHQDIIDEFVEKMKEQVNALKIGDPLKEETDIGAIISKAQLERIKKYIKMGEETEGVTAHYCSQLPTEEGLSGGNWVRPVIFTGMKNDHQVCREIGRAHV